MNWSSTHPRTTTAGEIPDRRPVWFTYFEPRTATLRNKLGVRDPERLARYERALSGAAYAEVIRSNPPERFDLSYLRHCHHELFRDVYPWAGELRVVNIANPADRERPFVYHGYIETHFRELTEQLRREGELRPLTDPRQWADRAGYYWAEINNCHPFREGNGRAARLFISQLAKASGHRLDWAMIRRDLGPDAVNLANRAGARADYEPMRALLQYAATGDRDRDSAPRGHLDALDHALGDELYSRIAIAAGVGRPAEREHLDLAWTAASTRLATLPSQYRPSATQPRTGQPATERAARPRSRSHAETDARHGDRRGSAGGREYDA